MAQRFQDTEPYRPDSDEDEDIELEESFVRDDPTDDPDPVVLPEDPAIQKNE